MHCHIYGIGLESTFNMHSNTHQFFLKVQCHLLSGKREMQVSVCVCSVWERESRAACLVYQLCRSRSNTSCHGRVALHWPLAHREKLTSTWWGGGNAAAGWEKGVSVVKSRRGREFLFCNSFSERSLALPFVLSLCLCCRDFTSWLFSHSLRTSKCNSYHIPASLWAAVTKESLGNDSDHRDPFISERTEDALG